MTDYCKLKVNNQSAKADGGIGNIFIYTTCSTLNQLVKLALLNFGYIYSFLVYSDIIYTPMDL